MNKWKQLLNHYSSLLALCFPTPVNALIFLFTDTSVSLLRLLTTHDCAMTREVFNLILSSVRLWMLIWIASLLILILILNLLLQLATVFVNFGVMRGVTFASCYSLCGVCCFHSAIGFGIFLVFELICDLLEGIHCVFCTPCGHHFVLLDECARQSQSRWRLKLILFHRLCEDVFNFFLSHRVDFSFKVLCQSESLNLQALS